MPRLLPLVLLCLLVLSACGTASGGSFASGDSASAPESTSESAPTTPQGGEQPDPSGADAAGGKVPAALQFRAATLDGREFEGADLAGRPAVLWFWAPWCPTCRAQAPGVAALVESYGDEVSVVGVGGLDETAAMQDFAAGVDDSVTLLADEEGALWRRFGVTSQSSYVVLDARGDTVVSGYLDDGQLRALVDDLAG